jgi:hypothetical protein
MIMPSSDYVEGRADYYRGLACRTQDEKHAEDLFRIADSFEQIARDLRDMASAKLVSDYLRAERSRVFFHGRQSCSRFFTMPTLRTRPLERLSG